MNPCKIILPLLTDRRNSKSADKLISAICMAIFQVPTCFGGPLPLTRGGGSPFCPIKIANFSKEFLFMTNIISI